MEFDVCEMSLASYLIIRERRLLPFLAIPVFPHRRFRHSYIFVNTSAGIEQPKDLEGRKIGIRTWQTTAALWILGTLDEQYGVDLTTIHWHRQDEEDIPLEVPPRFQLTQVRPEQNLNTMLVEGELDALIFPEIPSSFKRGDPRVKRLFDNVKAEEQRYFVETGHFPLMHTVVIKDSVLAAHPWVAESMLRAFQASKALAWERMEDPARLGLAWARQALEEQQRIMGKDPWPYDLPSNRTALEAMIRYSHRLGMIEQPMAPEDLFFSENG
jgi:4,5-dihydroxyphthalate decarboxylase